MTANNSNKPVIIFHRSKQNSEECLAGQQAFLEANRKVLDSAYVIDYVTGDYNGAQKVFEVFKNINSLPKVTVIMNSFLPKKDYDLHYNLYSYFYSFKKLGFASMYHMDCNGNLYKEVKSTEILRDNLKL